MVAEAHPAVAIGSYPFNRDGVFGANLVARSDDPEALAAAAEALRAMAAELEAGQSLSVCQGLGFAGTVCSIGSPGSRLPGVSDLPVVWANHQTKPIGTSATASPMPISGTAWRRASLGVLAVVRRHRNVLAVR